MRIKSKVITIEYAGATILQPGGHINGQEYGGSRNFTTAAETVIDAASPVMRTFGNAQGSMSFDVCVDFESEGEAIAEAMSRMHHLESNQVGEFSLTVDNISQRWKSGITSADWAISYTADAVRLIFSYNFTLAEVIS